MIDRVIDLGGPVHFIDFGGSGPPMVLVHGLGGAAINWLNVGPGLARRARVVALDLPGFGHTPPAGRSARLPAQRELLGRFLDAVAGGPAIVVGNSMGGLLAMMVAAEEPARVSHLVLAAPAQPLPSGTRIDREVFVAFLLYSLPLVAEWYLRRRSARLGADGLVDEMMRLCCADAARVPAELRQAHVDLAAERLASMPWSNATFVAAARSTLSSVRRPGRFFAMADRIAAPALLIQGVLDRLVPLAASRELARRRPDWTFEVVDDLGHVAQIEDPKRFVDTVSGWLDGAPLVRPSGRPL